MTDTTLKQYSVRADRKTGEWIGEPEYVGEVSRAEWLSKVDTDERIFSFYAHYEGEYQTDAETRAIEVIWS